jgi:hypothetical protein
MAAEIRRRTFSGAGRPRPPTKQGVSRYPGGQIRHVDRGEKAENIVKIAQEARERHFGLNPGTGSDPLLATAVGRLFKTGNLSAMQYGAAMRFARINAWTGILDDVRPAYGVPVLARLSCTSGRDPYDNIDPEQAWDVEDEQRRKDIIVKIRKDAAEMTSELWRMEMNPETAGAAYIISRVVLWDDAHALNTVPAMGAFRCGLNLLGKMWGLDKEKGETR